MIMESQSTLECVRASGGGTAAVDTMSFEGALLGYGAVVVWNDVAQVGRDQFYAWHDKQHMPERLELPGFRRGRRFARPGHSPEWLTMYEANDLSVVSSLEYLAARNLSVVCALNSQ
jgi:hypothetical protein